MALAIVALLAWARNDAGVDDRVPDPEDATDVVTDVDDVPPLAELVSDGTVLRRRRRRGDHDGRHYRENRPGLGRRASSTRSHPCWSSSRC